MEDKKADATPLTLPDNSTVTPKPYFLATQAVNNMPQIMTAEEIHSWLSHLSPEDRHKYHEVEPDKPGCRGLLMDEYRTLGAICQSLDYKDHILQYSEIAGKFVHLISLQDLYELTGCRKIKRIEHNKKFYEYDRNDRRRIDKALKGIASTPCIWPVYKDGKKTSHLIFGTLINILGTADTNEQGRRRFTFHIELHASLTANISKSYYKINKNYYEVIKKIPSKTQDKVNALVMYIRRYAHNLKSTKGLFQRTVKILATKLGIEKYVKTRPKLLKDTLDKAFKGMQDIGYIKKYWWEKDKRGDDKICCVVCLKSFYVDGFRQKRDDEN